MYLINGYITKWCLSLLKNNIFKRGFQNDAIFASPKKCQCKFQRKFTFQLRFFLVWQTFKNVSPL